MRDCMREACEYCYDFAAEFADLSVGSIGSELGWSTVILRSKVGVEIVKKAEAAGAIETKKLSKEQVKEVRRLASFKKRGNMKNILHYSILGLLKYPLSFFGAFRSTSD